MKFFKYTLITFLVLTLYVATAIPVGLFLYSFKMDLGINIFSHTGFHSYVSCLKQQAEKIDAGDFDQ